MACSEQDFERLTVVEMGLDDRTAAIRQAERAGHIVLHCGARVFGDQIVITDPVEKADTQLWFNELVSPDDAKDEVQLTLITGLIGGLAYEGFSRREGWLRRAVNYDEPATAVRYGDKVALRLPNDKIIYTEPVREAEARLVVATAMAPQLLPTTA